MNASPLWFYAVLAFSLLGWGVAYAIAHLVTRGAI